MDDRSYTTLQLERDGRLLRARFNRPEVLNAIDAHAHEELARFFGELATDAACEVCILSGAGRAFSAGGDLQHMQRMIDDPALFQRDLANAKRIIFGLLDCPKILIAQLNGPAIGLGATLALLCDVVFAATTASIGDPHVKVGLTAGDGGAMIWPHLLGHVRAKEYLMTGRVLSAVDAERLDLINHVVAPDELDARTEAFARELLGGAMRAIQWTKQSINLGLRQQMQAVLDASLAFEALSNQTADHQEGVRALRERRAPRFEGR